MFDVKRMDGLSMESGFGGDWDSIRMLVFHSSNPLGVLINDSIRIYLFSK